MKKLLTLFLALIFALNVSVICFATDYKSSPERNKPSVIEDDDGNAGTIEDKRGKVVVDIPGGDIVVTPISDVDDSEGETSDRLNRAKKIIDNTDDLSDVIDNYDEEMKKRAPNNDPDDFVIDDVFDISVDDDYEKYLNGDNTFTVVIDIDDDNVNTNWVIYSKDGERWAFLDTSCVVDLGNGKYRFTLSSNCLIGILKLIDVDNPDGPTSPDTGDNVALLLTTGLTVSVLGCSLVIKSKKKDR